MFDGDHHLTNKKFCHEDVPMQNDKYLENPHEKHDIENQLPYNAKSTAKDRRSCFHSGL